MSLGPIMLDLESTELAHHEIELLTHKQVGGLILFSRNYSCTQQLTELIHSVRQVRPELLIAVDQEGGRVQRLHHEFTHLPAPNTLGKLYDLEPKQALETAYLFGWLLASEVLAYNIDFSFTPVLDIDYGISEVIGDRSFANNPTVLTTIAKHFIRGMHSAGMAATGKHFPGHGAVAADSHVDLPIDERDYDSIFQQDIYPFQTLIHDHDHSLDAIMPAHVIYSKVDSQPAGFSNLWLQEILRNKLGFTGIIFSDDLSMEAASCVGSYTKRASMALAAGCDMILICNNRKAALEVIEHLDQQHFQLQTNLQIMQRRIKWTPDQLQTSEKWQQAIAAVEKLHTLV